jgi:hypothetical protein
MSFLTPQRIEKKVTETVTNPHEFPYPGGGAEARRYFFWGTICTPLEIEAPDGK